MPPLTPFRDLCFTGLDPEIAVGEPWEPGDAPVFGPARSDPLHIPSFIETFNPARAEGARVTQPTLEVREPNLRLEYSSDGGRAEERADEDEGEGVAGWGPSATAAKALFAAGRDRLWIGVSPVSWSVPGESVLDVPQFVSEDPEGPVFSLYSYPELAPGLKIGDTGVHFIDRRDDGQRGPVADVYGLRPQRLWVAESRRLSGAPVVTFGSGREEQVLLGFALHPEPDADEPDADEPSAADLVLHQPGAGIVLADPEGRRWRLYLDEAGHLASEPVDGPR